MKNWFVVRFNHAVNKVFSDNQWYAEFRPSTNTTEFTIYFKHAGSGYRADIDFSDEMAETMTDDRMVELLREAKQDAIDFRAETMSMFK